MRLIRRLEGQFAAQPMDFVETRVVHQRGRHGILLGRRRRRRRMVEGAAAAAIVAIVLLLVVLLVRVETIFEETIARWVVTQRIQFG